MVASSSRSCCATSSSRTGPSARVTRRTSPRASSAVPGGSSWRIGGSTSRRRRELTRARWTDDTSPSRAAGSVSSRAAMRGARSVAIRDRRAILGAAGDYRRLRNAYYSRHRPMRLAAIDIGTNSVHMIVVQVRADFSFEVIDREKEMVRLGAGGLDGKKLTQEAMSSALQALSKFERLAKSHEVDQILAAATSATREAENGGEFLKTIERTTGIRPRIITGTDEARLIHLAAVYGVDTPKRAVVIDVGGGSVEITLGTREEVKFARSFKIGAIRLTERFVTTDPLSGRDERKLVQHISTQVDRYIAQVVAAGYDQVIGTSGTILSLGTVATALDRGSVPSEIRNLRVEAKSIHRLRKAVTELDLAKRLKLQGLDPRRADLVVAGAVLVDTLLKKLDAREITLCDLALREGLVLDYIEQHRTEIARVDRYPDVRRRSTIELAERSQWEAEHSKRVARLALSLFDPTRESHGLGDRER